MCRWMAWHGQPVIMEELLFNSPHGLIEQSLHSRLGAETTNGDGFGVGWYGTGEGPGVFHSVSPAWGNANLRELAAHIESPLFMAHVRATSGSAIQESNCHPFKHGDWLFAHNGLVGGYDTLRRELMLAVVVNDLDVCQTDPDDLLRREVPPLHIWLLGHRAQELLLPARSGGVFGESVHAFNCGVVCERHETRP